MCRLKAAAVAVKLDEKGEKAAVPKEKRDSVRSRSRSERSPDGPDGSESVRIAMVCTVVAFLCSAGFRSAGFLYIGIMDTYGVSRQDASWPLSIIGAVTNLAGVVAGPLCQRFPTRPVMCGGALAASTGMILSFWASSVAQLAVCLGVLYGFGCGVVFTVINVTLAQYFDKYRAVAFGLVYAGSTMASLVFPNLLLALNSIYPFKSVLLLFGGIILNMFALSLYIKEPSRIRSSSSNVKGAEDRSSSGKASLRESLSIFREPIFYACLLSNILFQYGFDAFMTTLVDFAVDRGASLQQAVNLLPWFSVADVIGRGTFPIAADRGLIGRPKLIMSCYILTGVFTILLPSATSYTELVVFILLMGPFCGCCATLFCCVVGDFIGVRRLPFAFGILGTSNGFFYLSKPFVFGHFRDVVLSYDGMFHATGTLTLLTGLMWICIVGSTRRKMGAFSVTTPPRVTSPKLFQGKRSPKSEVRINIIELRKASGCEKPIQPDERAI